MLWRVVASGAVQGHVEFVTERGVVSIVMTCQRVVEPHIIHYREWSSVVAIIMTCQRVRICRLELDWDV